MEYCFITLRSLTTAQRAEGILQKRGIRCVLQRAPRWMEEQGCGNGLRVDCDDISEALALLRSNRIPYKRAYLKRDDGSMEEMEL